MASKQIKAIIIVIVLSIAAYFGIQKAKEKANFSENADQEISLIDRLEKDGAPNFSAKRLDGSIFTVESVRGKVVILNFWASWCDPCVREFPSMLKLVEHFKGEIILVAVSNDSSKAEIENFVKAMGGSKPHVEIVWDEDYKIAGLFGTSKLPESYLFNRKMKLVRKIVGIDDWYTKDAIDYMASLIKQE
ncbi:MAG: TlpA disulfide reductase family protein [Pseudomonadota bacterium]|nr:TlpA disulfide reductase family protein [Pseudomonadota bacterium]